MRATHSNPNLLDRQECAVLRTALSLARIEKIRTGGVDVRVRGFLHAFREEVVRKLKPILTRKSPPSREDLAPLVKVLRDPTLNTRDALASRLASRVPADTLHREITEKALVLVLGGGGGTGYVYIGVISLLDELGHRPRLMVGTSIGAVLSLFRSRMAHFDKLGVMNIIRGLSWNKLFRAISMESRYGVPAALRLFLRAGIGHHFRPPDGPEGSGLRLADLPIPTLVSVSGIRRGMLPHPVEFYERVLDLDPQNLRSPLGVAKEVQTALSAVAELFRLPEVMEGLILGADAVTAGFDAVDAAGFSCALPGLIHYDVLRDDPRMRQLLDELCQTRGVFRLVDGGMTNNLPLRAAWEAVDQGIIGTRNVFVLGLNGFSPNLLTPLWLPLQRLAELNVSPNRPYGHLVKDFRATLSPLELVPSVASVLRAIDLGRAQLSSDIAFLRDILSPLPAL